MSIKIPNSPLSNGAEPPAPTSASDLQKIVGGQFEAELAALEAAPDHIAAARHETVGALRQIAAQANLETPAQAFAAIKDSARCIINSRLGERFRQHEKLEQMLEDISSHVARDPFLQGKLLKILQRLKE